MAITKQQIGGVNSCLGRLPLDRLANENGCLIDPVGDDMPPFED